MIAAGIDPFEKKRRQCLLEGCVKVKNSVVQQQGRGTMFKRGGTCNKIGPKAVSEENEAL